MKSETRVTDAKGRLTLPKSFANSTVIVERVSDNEVRVRRAKVVAADDYPMREEATMTLSDRDRDLFIKLIDVPPAPQPSLRKAVSRYRARRG